MKHLIIFLIFTSIAFGQGNMLLLMDDENVQRLTITASSSSYKIDDGGSYYFQVAGTAGKTFRVDWGDGTTSEITFIGATTDQRIAKTYTNAGTYKVKIYGWQYVTRLRWANWNAGAFNLQGLPAGLTYLILYALGTNFTGSIDNLPTGITYLYLHSLGTNLTGAIDNLPTGLTTLILSSLGTNLTGAIGSLKASIGTMSFISSGSNFDLTTSLKAFNSATITITPQTGQGYTTAEIDAFLNAYDAVAGTGVKTIDLRGSNQPRSSASDAAVISLTAKGRTILTNP